MNNFVVSVECLDSEFSDQARQCASSLGVELGYPANADYALVFANGGLSLQNCRQPKVGEIAVDFVGGAAAHRRKFGGGTGQLIAKACGVSSRIKPSIFDATAGLGQDAFVLASLHCTVTMMERSPVAYYLLQDGLRRAHLAGQTDADLLAVIERMTLLKGDSVPYLEQAQTPLAGVVYLDPMFPPKQKNALAKKEMTAFHDLIGLDIDEAELLDRALKAAEYRVVVKRSRLAPAIAGVSPSFSHQGKSSRFDVYGIKRLPR